MIPEARKKRGEIDTLYIRKHAHLSNEQLMLLLNDKNAQQRSVAATILGERRISISVPILCERLSKEKALYSKIAISNSIVKFGTSAIEELGMYIGKIGKNRHTELPKEIFKKKNYPLPRDIVIRTIIRMGTPALPYLQSLLKNKNSTILSEVVDSIGHITFYSKDYRALNDLIELFDNSGKSDVLRWKVIRAFQSFPQKEIVSRLKKVLEESVIPSHRWEAVRSLAQINTKETKLLVRKCLNDSNSLGLVTLKINNMKHS